MENKQPAGCDLDSLTRHELKTDPAVFAAVLAGAKTHEIRKNDRGFAVGDELLLRETTHTGAEIVAGASLAYTGRDLVRTVTHVLTGYGLQDGWCILSLADVRAAQAPQGDTRQGANTRTPADERAAWSPRADIEFGRLLDLHRAAQIDHSRPQGETEYGKARKALFEYIEARTAQGAGTAPVLYARQMDLDMLPSTHGVPTFSEPDHSGAGGDWSIPLYRTPPAPVSTAAATTASASDEKWEYRVSAGPATGWSLWNLGRGDEFEKSYKVERRIRKVPSGPVSTAAASDMLMLPRAVIDSTLDALRKAQMFKFSTALSKAAGADPAATVSTASATTASGGAIKTWQERAGAPADANWEVWTGIEEDMAAEIAEWRAFGAALAPSRAADGQQGTSLAALTEARQALENSKSEDLARDVERRRAIKAIDAALACNLPAQGAAQVEVEAARDEMTPAARDVLAERQRQVEVEGWHPDQDDDYEDGQLSMAAACYAMQGDTPNYGPPADWPWDREWWKPADDRRNLVKAGALILADIERIDRAALAAKQENDNG